jgi:hypothetical protein
MSKAVAQHVFLPDSDAVYVVLDHGIAPLQLVIGPDYIYSGTLNSGLDSGVVYTYKFRINGNVWETVTRSFESKQGIVTLSSWWNDDPANQTIFKVNMGYAASSGLFNPETDTVCIVGTMNNMLGSPGMQRMDSSLVYTYQYSLDPGSVHRYKFRINADSAGLELLNKPDRMFRTPDTLIHVSADFNNYNPGKRLITFNCNMKYYINARHFDPSLQFVDVAGNFNESGSNDVLFDIDGDSIYSLQKYLDTTWFNQGPLAFRFRIDADGSQAELTGKPDRNYSFHDTVNQNPNIYSCYYNNLDPAIPTPPWAYNVSIQGLLIYKKILTGSYSYENVNGVHEGISTYRWLRSNNAQGLNAVPIDSALKITYVVDTLDIGKWLVFEVTPKALSGDSAAGKPVQVVSSNSISAWDLGMSDLTSMSVKVFPNPAENFIRVITDGTVDRFEIFNYLEQRVMNQNSVNASMLNLSVGGLTRGIYLLKVIGRDGRSGVARIIKL